MHVLDVLRQRGYIPQDDPDESEAWYDLRQETAGSRHTVRAILHDEGEAHVLLFAGPYIAEWQAHFTPGTPGPVFLAVLDAAEKEAKGSQR